MEVATVESSGQKTELLKNLVKNWIQGTEPSKAIDKPKTVNPACGHVKM